MDQAAVLKRERDKACFHPDGLTRLLDGSLEEMQRRRDLEGLVLDNPAFHQAPLGYLSREQCYELAIKKSVLCVELFREHGIEDLFERSLILETAFPFEASPFTLHTSMFTTTLLSQASDQLQNLYLDKAMNYQILGTYAQTELGHGTFLRGLETTATYDPTTREFVLHSPTLTSMKWWPGALGHTVNFAVVVAQLYSLGVCHGPHMFLVQIRSLDDHKPLKGVTVGDIGAKMGYNNVDNGFLKFTHHRIPYTHMLMKHNKLLPDGRYIQRTTQKTTYGTMVIIRAMIISHFSRHLAAAATIATRYSLVRRQGKISQNQTDESCILDYRTQQYKLLPLITTCFAYNFVGQYMKSMLMGYLQASNQSGQTQVLPELHALAAGLKACTSATCAAGIEVCRQACGGHGYMEAAGISRLYRDIVPACTYEGENTVMLLQTARYLMKCFSDRQSLPDSSSVFYLRQSLTSRGYIDDDVRTCDLIDAYRHRAQRLVFMSAEEIEKAMKTGMSWDEAWNRCSILLIKTATAHCHYFLVRTFHEAVGQKLADMNEAVRPLVFDMVALYACHGVVENSGEFVEDGYLVEGDIRHIWRKVDQLLDKLRPQALSIVDSFDLRDELLRSALGRYDGHVYQSLYDHARESPFNKSQVHPVYDKYLRSMFKAKL